MSTKKKLLEAAAGNAGGGATYVDDVFSTFLYTGNGGTQTITNGVDLSGEGGLVWFKRRDDTGNHYVFDTERGVGGYLLTDFNMAEATAGGLLSSFNSDGVTTDGLTSFNTNTHDFVSWSFRKAPGFFDIVTYTGNGTAGRTVSHNLGSVPGMIIVKSLTNNFDWQVYHRSKGNTHGGTLNEAYAFADSATYWNDTSPTSAQFTVGNGNGVNFNNEPYVAYLFAHDAQEFGTDSDESIIKCGSYTGTGVEGTPEINLGWEPQWLLIKRTNASEDWVLVDNMRGLPVGSDAKVSRPNSSSADFNSRVAELTATGFKVGQATGRQNGNGDSYIYMAIRRPHKPAEEFAATDLFKVSAGNNTDPTFNSGFVTDFNFYRNVTGSSDFFTPSRLTGPKYLSTNSTAAESTSSGFTWDFMNGFRDGTLNTDFYSWMWKRAPGYFDVVAYKGTGSNGVAIPHNLGVVPELVIIKARTTTYDWMVAFPTGTPDGRSQSVSLNLDSAIRNERLFPSGGQLPDASNVYLAAENRVNSSVHTYIMYLFATVAGISKIGTFTRTSGDTTNVDCGFSNGARFVLFKRIIGGTGNWTVYDTVRGIVTGNDPYLFLNSTAPQVTNTDYIDPYSAGFTITSGIATGTFIFYAIA